ncbi:MAG TPA: alpha/beta fold hydrolase, partial [Longimicrobiales bacterium]
MTRIALAILTLCAAQNAVAQDRLSGHWRGYWLRAGDTMTVAMDIRRDAATSRYTATFDADRLRVTGSPFADLALEGCCNVTLTLRGDRTTTTFTGTLRGDSLSGAFRDADGEGRFAFVRARGGGGVVEKEITFQNGPATLSGSLLMPRRGDALTAVVFLHGSGGEGRWASRFLALQLVQQGVAALIFDKRGVGKSTGDWRAASVDDLVGDAVAAVARLRQEPRINARSIGIHGHSQGGTIAPMVAVRSNQVGFVIAS